jgi:basic membrane lipoprotein Med (substrate-binding protein (PBP1-ABC) superfamily)/DNA-binding SARP family transcriptional activator
MMEFRILGPLEARSDGEPVDLGPHKQRALLALLLIHADRVVSTDRILDELWGDDADGKAKALWVHISRLRSALEPNRVERGQSSMLITRDHGYMLRTDPDTVDAHRFEVEVAAASTRLKDDPDRAAEILRGALGLWRGSALQDFAYDEFAQAEITRLEELRLATIEMRIDADLRRGLASELIGELETLVQQHPLRERPVGQLMHAFYRAGRQAEALRAFQRFRRGIGEELGIEPSPELRRLEEQILLHDPRLAPLADRRDEKPATNPFKGLRAFQEADAEDFFGRDRLVAEVITRLADGCRLVALVGPSGSGKSSVARAGVVPALRKGAVSGSERWLVAPLVPGTHPFAELEAALLRATIDAPDSLAAQLADPTLGLLRAALRLLPDDARLVVVIDQFEELFTLVDDEAERRSFLANLVAALDDPRGRVLVVLTLRADSYHRPLEYGEFAARLGPAVVNVLPLTSDELEEAAEQPAARHGVTAEPALLAELLTDVIGEPGGLPVFQYALTELFERRAGDRLTLAAYRAMGGVRGALSRRADDLYHRLTLDEQEAARQLFLRLVTITEHEQWSRRRVPASELVTMDVDVVTMESVIDQLGRHRFLAFDRDHGTGAPTVEVAHEALLSEWDRLRGWIEEGRVDITRRAALDAALAEWNQSERDSDYLLGGNRLAEYARWRAATPMRLTVAEQEYLDASVARRDQAAAAETARAAREAGVARRARRRWWALVAVIVAFATAGTAIWVFGPSEPPGVAMLPFAGGGNRIDQLMVDGLERAAREFDFKPIDLAGPFPDVGDELASLGDSGTDLVLIPDPVYVEDGRVAAAKYPETTWAYIDLPGDDAPAVTFAAHEGAYLAGAAAALTSKTGTIGYVGGFQEDVTELFRAGFEAGARAMNPQIEIIATYTSFDTSGFLRSDLAQEAATEMYQRGADVVLHAGSAGAGVFTAAREQSERQGRRLWAIGADSDQYLDVPEQDRPYVLTSTIKRYDLAVYELIRDFLDGGLEPVGRELTLADGAVGYSTTGDHLSPDTIATLENLKHEIVTGGRTVPRSPSGALQPPPTVTHGATVTFDGSTCRYDGPTSLETGDVVHIELVNTTSADAHFAIWYTTGSLVEIAAQPGGTNEGYAQFPAGNYSAWCYTRPSTGAPNVPGPTFEVPAAPPAPIPPGTPAAEAEHVAGGFLDAYGAFDADRAISYLTDDAILAILGRSESPEHFRLGISVMEAIGYQQTINGCEEQGGDPSSGIRLRCTFDLHALGSDELGHGPYTGNYWDLTVRDGKLVSASLTWAYTTNGFSRQMWEPFAKWIGDEYPDDVLLMYEDASKTGFRFAEDSIHLWEQHTREYVARTRERAGGETLEQVTPSSPDS